MLSKWSWKGGRHVDLSTVVGQSGTFLKKCRKFESCQDAASRQNERTLPRMAVVPCGSEATDNRTLTTQLDCGRLTQQQAGAMLLQDKLQGECTHL
jgi:hypothetical protein